LPALQRATGRVAASPSVPLCPGEATRRSTGCGASFAARRARSFWEPEREAETPQAA
jgi:hypothetical protein